MCIRDRVYPDLRGALGFVLRARVSQASQAAEKGPDARAPTKQMDPYRPPDLAVDFDAARRPPRPLIRFHAAGRGGARGRLLEEGPGVVRFHRVAHVLG